MDKIAFLNYDFILNSPSFVGVVKSTLYQIRERGYMSLPEFLGSITGPDLDLLNRFSDDVLPSSAASEAEKDFATQNLLALTTALALCEGAASDMSAEEAHANMTTLMINLNLEQLSRMGLVEFIRENASFIDTEKMLAKRI